MDTRGSNHQRLLMSPAPAAAISESIQAPIFSAPEGHHTSVA